MTGNPVRKKIIEVSIPLEAINVASAREKSIRHGHPSTLHLWWARRPLAACRAVLFAQLVDDPSSWPDRYPFPEVANTEDSERKRLHKIIERLVPWEASNDERILNEARWEIARSVAWGLGEEPPPQGDGQQILDYLQAKAPPVYDPFCGGGSIPLEAQRLGLRAYGSDLNPVAVLISKALVEIPPKFAGFPPVNPDAQAALKTGGTWNGKGAQGLAEDVRYYGRWMRDEAEKRIGHLYPNAQLPDGAGATVIAWLWARTVRSPDPSAKGAMVPLVSSFMLSAKEGQKAWVEPVIDLAAPDGYWFQVHSGALAKPDEERLRAGTKGEGRGSNFSCVLTGATIRGDYIKAEGMAGRMGARLLAIIAEGKRARVYLSPDHRHEALAASLDDDDRVADMREVLNQPVPERLTGGTCYSYGLTTFGKLFTPRQLVALTTLSNLVGEVQARVLADARADRFSSDGAALHTGGAGAQAYADAIATYLALAVDKVTEGNTTLCTWSPLPTKLHVVSTFGRQALPMVWDYAESNPFADSSGNMQRMAFLVAKVIEYNHSISCGVGFSSQRAASSECHLKLNISTDPPYYDNISYAALADFFYVWLKRSLVLVWPDLFRRLTTPKDEELIASPHRHGGQQEAENYFMSGMSRALGAMRSSMANGEPLSIYYAFKQSETDNDGMTSAGWASFLQAIVDAGLGIDGTWPVRTERAGGFRNKDANALASSIVLICRNRTTENRIITRTEFIRALKRELPDAIEDIRRAGVGPVDMQQSVIGPGMGIFTRYANVLEDDDSTMAVKTALALINRVWEEIESELDANFEPRHRWHWRGSPPMASIPGYPGN
jgi:putative DNA methylase